MKTAVRSISIRGEYETLTINMRMPNGDLKRRYLMNLLRHEVVIPSLRVNRLLLEVLNELDAAYRAQAVLSEDAESAWEALDVLNDKHEGEIEELLGEIDELKDDVSDLQAEIAEMAHAKKLLEQRLKIYQNLSNGKVD